MSKCRKQKFPTSDSLCLIASQLLSPKMVLFPASLDPKLSRPMCQLDAVRLTCKKLAAEEIVMCFDIDMGTSQYLLYM